jgi:NAD+ synthase (glutamine-hydrolysing)
MKLALAQLNPTVGALRYNTGKIACFYREAAAKGARLAVFPELAVTGYPPQDLLLYRGFIESVEKIVADELAPLTAGSDTAMLVGAPYRVDNALYNTALLLEKGSIKSAHLKTLLPNYDVFDERRYFTPSPGSRIDIIGGIPAAVTVCEDIWNDRDFFDRPAYDRDPLEELSGRVKLIINLSASPYHLGKQALREKMIGFLAAKYKAGLVYVNQVGGNDELIFDGASLAFNDRGELIRRASSFEEELLFIESEALFSPTAAPAPPLGEGIGSVCRALVLGIKDYLGKTGFRKAVLGLSGGIDSAVTAALAAEALGPENVLGVLMPSLYSSGHSVEDAAALARNLGIAHRIIPIERPFNAFLELFNPAGAPRQDLAEENLQARIRGNILMFISNREGYLALTTGNKSELAAGYCTLYGDMSGGLAVLADVPKVMVYDLARHLNEKHGREIIPARTLTKAPSAELRPGQKDEDSLPPYGELDPILHHYIEENLSPAEMIDRGHDPARVRRIVGLVDRAEYKRRQAAPGLRVTTRAFGSGRRMPIARGYDY